MAQVLIIDDQDRYAALCRKAIPEHDYVGPARCWAQAKDVLRKNRRVDLVLLDVHFDIPAEDLVGLPDDADERTLARVRSNQGAHILEKLRRSHPELPVILMTSMEELSIEKAADDLHAEDYTYFLDDEYVDANALRAQIEGILRARRGQEQEGPIFWGRGLTMRRIRSQLMTLARGRLPLIIGGPTGTGKSLIARHFVHARSGRSGRFVAVDLSTLSKELMAAHLFGSMRGSYTGSVADRKGAFEEADGGTLFLDEIGNLTDDAQKMLLTVLQEGAVTRMGDVRERKVDVKLVVATNESLPELVEQGKFRADLYMRLNPACTVSLPSLTERQLDMGRLLQFCVDRAFAGPYLTELYDEYCSQHGLDKARLQVSIGDTIPDSRPDTVWLLLGKKAMTTLRGHPWPGNLREFAMTVENAMVFTFAELAQIRSNERPDVVQVRPKLVRDLVRHTQGQRPDAPSDGWKLEVAVRASDTLNHVAADVERQYFRSLYVVHQGDFRDMARVLMGDPDCARKVQLRFNQLGLKVRELRKQLGG